MSRAINYYKKFLCRAKKSDLTIIPVHFIKFLYLRNMYGIGLDHYFDYELWEKPSKHKALFETMEKYIHKWKNVYPKFKPKQGLPEFLYKVDYLFCKLRYPGIDAMDYFRYQFYEITHYRRKDFITQGQLVKMNRYFNADGSKTGSYDILFSKIKFEY